MNKFIVAFGLILSACGTTRLEQRKINALQCKAECEFADGYAYVASYDICLCGGSKYTAALVPQQGVKQ